MSKVITLIALAAAAHVHAIEHDAAGNVIPDAAVRFVSSDETLFTVTPSADAPLTAELHGLREGSGVLSVFDADGANLLHVSFDVIVQPAVAANIELDDNAGVKIDPISTSGANDLSLLTRADEDETRTDLEQAQHDASGGTADADSDSSSSTDSDSGASGD